MGQDASTKAANLAQKIERLTGTGKAPAAAPARPPAAIPRSPIYRQTRKGKDIVLPARGSRPLSSR